MAPSGAESGRALRALIETADAGTASAADQLFAMLYRDLHDLAERQLRRSGAGDTLGTTSLLHDLYLSLADRPGTAFPDRARFLGYAARAMRGLIIDRFRRRGAVKRGAEFRLVRFEGDAQVLPPEPSGDLEAIDAALQSLGTADPALAELVDLHFFAGFSLVEIAGMRGVSDRTVQRDWRKARLLLFHELEAGRVWGGGAHG
jgi:RNA polymerase sigma factor (TIGR02999 family)